MSDNKFSMQMPFTTIFSLVETQTPEVGVFNFIDFPQALEKGFYDIYTDIVEVLVCPSVI